MGILPVFEAIATRLRGVRFEGVHDSWGGCPCCHAERSEASQCLTEGHSGDPSLRSG
jgi:hypothetical protein